jgi:hypothetical protein
MFTADAEQAQKWGFDPANAVTAEVVAEVMLDLVANNHPGGTSLEVSKTGTRKLGVWNIEPPTSVGVSLPQHAIDANYARLNTIMNEERNLQ